MPVTDTEQLIREATRTILTASTDLQTLFGRATRLVVERNSLNLETPVPVIAYDVLNYDEAAGRAVLLLTAITKDATNAGQKARAALEICKAVLTTETFLAQSLDYIVPLDGVRQSVDEVEDIRGFLELDSPTLTQADWSLPLLVLN